MRSQEHGKMQAGACKIGADEIGASGPPIPRSCRPRSPWPLPALFVLSLLAAFASGNAPPALASLERSDGRVWLVMASRSSAQEAVRFARAAREHVSAAFVTQTRNGLFAIIAGHLDPERAETNLATLRALRLVPPDAFLSRGENHQNLVWPTDAGLRMEDVVSAPALIASVTSMQEALSRLGFYRSRIDGLIGPGTRRALRRFERRYGRAGHRVRDWSADQVLSALAHRSDPAMLAERRRARRQQQSERLAQRRRKENERRDEQRRARMARAEAQAQDRGFRTVNEMNEAESAGFNEVREFRAAREGGFETKAAWQEAREKGFTQARAYEAARKGAFEDAAEYEAAREAGFERAEPFRKARKAGFESRREYEAARRIGYDEADAYRAFKTSGFQTPVAWEAAREQGYASRAAALGGERTKLARLRREARAQLEDAAMFVRAQRDQNAALALAPLVAAVTQVMDDDASEGGPDEQLTALTAARARLADAAHALDAALSRNETFQAFHAEQEAERKRRLAQAVEGERAQLRAFDRGLRRWLVNNLLDPRLPAMAELQRDLAGADHGDDLAAWRRAVAETRTALQGAEIAADVERMGAVDTPTPPTSVTPTPPMPTTPEVAPTGGVTRTASVGASTMVAEAMPTGAATGGRAGPAEPRGDGVAGLFTPTARTRFVLEGPLDGVVALYRVRGAPHIARNMRGDFVFTDNAAQLCLPHGLPEGVTQRSLARALRDAAPDTLDGHGVRFVAGCDVAGMDGSDVVLLERGRLLSGSKMLALALLERIEDGRLRAFDPLAGPALRAAAAVEASLVDGITADLAEERRSGFVALMLGREGELCRVGRSAGARTDLHEVALRRGADALELPQMGDRVSLSAEDAFVGLQRGRCGAIYGATDELSALVRAMQRDGFGFTVAPFRYAMADHEAVLAEERRAARARAAARERNRRRRAEAARQRLAAARAQDRMERERREAEQARRRDDRTRRTAERRQRRADERAARLARAQEAERRRERLARREKLERERAAEEARRQAEQRRIALERQRAEGIAEARLAARNRREAEQLASARTAALREANHAPATARLNRVRAIAQAAFDLAVEGNRTQRNLQLARTHTPGLVRFQNEVESDRWEHRSLAVEIEEFGDARWDGRKVEAIVARIEPEIANADLGRYRTRCFRVALLFDDEFDRLRAAREMSCDDGAAAREWTEAYRLESRWTVRPDDLQSAELR